VSLVDLLSEAIRSVGQYPFEIGEEFEARLDNALCNLGDLFAYSFIPDWNEIG
jgi:hypothetical protein